MPRLVKGGKFVYGMSRVNRAGDIFIPPQAMREYGYNAGDKVILMSGSRTSGGFGLTQADILAESDLREIIERLPELRDSRLPEAKTVMHQGRRFCWTIIKEGGYINIPPETLAEYGVAPGELLVVGRGSRLSIAFIARGRILEQALKHPELALFERQP